MSSVSSSSTNRAAGVTVARAMTVASMLLVGVVLSQRLLGLRRAPPDLASPVCATPVQVDSANGSIVACGSDSGLNACGRLAAGARVYRADKLCYRVDGGMRPDWRLAYGLKLDLNRLSVAELDLLPGIGHKRAMAIVDERQRRGRFATVDELADVHGIGATTLARLSKLVDVYDHATSP